MANVAQTPTPGGARVDGSPRVASVEVKDGTPGGEIRDAPVVGKPSQLERFVTSFNQQTFTLCRKNLVSMLQAVPGRLLAW